MESGKLGGADLAVGVDTTIYTVPAATSTAATVAFCNRSANPVVIRLAIAEANPPGAGDYLEYDAVVPANGVLERSGVVMGAGELVVARASAAGVSVRVHGFEEVA